MSDSMSDPSSDHAPGSQQGALPPGEGLLERRRIDSGQAGDKVDARDPAASPLGTDDEAAGGSPDVDGLAIARQAENPDAA